LQEAHRELLAQERLSSLGQLTASVAHELRNPLSTLRNTMHAIQQIAQARAIDIERQVNRCQRTIDRCEGIVGDLLDFAATRELRAAATRLDVWLGGLLDNAKVPPAIELARRFDAPLAVVPIDSDRLRCAIVNLIDNAVTAIADSPDLAQRRITVATMIDNQAVVAITDTGPGMTPDVLERVFEPLFSTRAFGTGLGLPTVKQIVEQHGGSIVIASTPGAGTRIELRLPLCAGKTAKAAAA
jgi:signal transduction histidine kinase